MVINKELQSVTMTPINDALSLEYKLKEGCAIGNFNVSDAVNNPFGLGIVWISGYGLQKEIIGFFDLDASTFGENGGDLSLIGNE